LTGNLALVLDGRRLAELGDVTEVMEVFAGLARAYLPEGYRTPVTLRLRLEDAALGAGDASSEIRFKLKIPGSALGAGTRTVTALAGATVECFTRLLGAAELRPLLDET
jgi:hypothetical protein